MMGEKNDQTERNNIILLNKACVFVYMYVDVERCVVYGYLNYSCAK